jgi:hypothetical protein
MLLMDLDIQAIAVVPQIRWFSIHGFSYLQFTADQKK